MPQVRHVPVAEVFGEYSIDDITNSNYYLAVYFNDRLCPYPVGFKTGDEMSSSTGYVVTMDQNVNSTTTKPGNVRAFTLDTLFPSNHKVPEHLRDFLIVHSLDKALADYDEFHATMSAHDKEAHAQHKRVDDK